MKRTYFSRLSFIALLMVLNIYANSLYAQEFKVTKGMTLKYHVNDGENKYNMYVMVKDVFPDVYFDWVIINPKCVMGTIKIGSEAWKSADKQNNLFDPGFQKLTEQTCLWVSQYIYTALKNNAEVKMTPDQEEKHYARKEYKDYPLTMDGKATTIKTMYMESDDAKDKFWIADSKNSPIIFKMSFGYSMELYEINSVEKMLPGLQIKGNDIATLIGRTMSDPNIYLMSHPIGDSCDFIPVYKAPDLSLTYRCQANGIAIYIKNDIVQTIELYNTLKGDENNSWSKYVGELPGGITFDMKREAIEKLLGTPTGTGKDANYADKKFVITYASDDAKKAKIHHLTFSK